MDDEFVQRIAVLLSQKLTEAKVSQLDSHTTGTHCVISIWGKAPL